HDKKAYLDQRQLKPNTTSSIRTLPPPSRTVRVNNKKGGKRRRSKRDARTGGPSGPVASTWVHVCVCMCENGMCVCYIDSLPMSGKQFEKGPGDSHSRRMGETRPGIKPMRKSVAGQQQQQQHHHKREVAQAQEYVGVGDSGDLEASAPRSPPLKLTARTRDPNPTARRRKVSDETKEEIEEEDEATLRELLVSLQRQVSVMSMNLSAKLDELQRGDRQLETTVALCEIRSQLQELTKSVESCQSEVSEVKRDMVAIKHELDTVQQVKEEIEELREYVDRLGEQSHRRKLRLLEQGLTFFLSYAILAAVLGMLQFGYNTGVINAPEVNIENFMKDVYKSRYGEDIQDDSVKLLYSLAVSIFAIGGMLGGICGGMIANRFGRKGGLLLNSLLGIVGAVLMGCTKLVQLYEFLFLGRFIIGVNCGLNTSLVPMYISEIAPLNLRGGLGTVNQLAVTVGLLLSQVLGIEQILGTDEESPRYLLITKQWEEEARHALRRLRASNQVEEDIEEMRAEERAQQAEATISMMELICSPTLRSPLIIGVVMQLSQQLSGINAVFYYSTLLFISSGAQR
ncbi:hypothetical protein L9F63_025674, partial [Diploptera punctata]